MADSLESGWITTPMTWAATVNMIKAQGGKAVFVDIHPDALQIDERDGVEAVKDVLSRRSARTFQGFWSDR